MNELVSIIRQFFSELKFWLIIAPWEQAVLVRCGKHVRVLDGGMYFRCPIIDSVYIQSIRQRVATLNRQTVTLTDGRAITFSACIGYSVNDVLKLYQSVHHAEGTIINMVRAEVASDIMKHNTPDMVRVLAKLEPTFKSYGLAGMELYFTEYAACRTYRLIGDYSGDSSYGSSLNTEQAHGAANG